MEEVILVAVWLFLLTHVDTLAVLVAFCGNHHYRVWEIATGHAFGFLVGLLAAVVGAVMLLESLQAYAYLLGVIPLALGVWGVFKRESVERPEPAGVSSRVGRVGIVTTAGIGVSGENLAVFIPFFLTLRPLDLAVVLAVYVAGAAVVFVLAVFIGRHPRAAGLPPSVERWLVPTTLMIVGAYVLTAGWIHA